MSSTSRRTWAERSACVAQPAAKKIIGTKIIRRRMTNLLTVAYSHRGKDTPGERMVPADPCVRIVLPTIAAKCHEEAGKWNSAAAILVYIVCTGEPRNAAEDSYARARTIATGSAPRRFSFLAPWPDTGCSSS